jgi:hypothetical protein
MSTQPLSIPFSEHLKSLPEIFGIRLNEEPDYEPLLQDGAVELRRYPAMRLATVKLSGLELDEFRTAAFGTLARYIFGGNARGLNIPMTSPVFMSECGTRGRAKRFEGREWAMSFVLPAKFTDKAPPQPKNPLIKIEKLPGFEAAALTYSGNNSLDKIEAHAKELVSWLKHHPGLKAQGGYLLAQYDAPFALPFFKRNEILGMVSVTQ